MHDARDTGRTRAIPETSRRHLLAGASAALIAGAVSATAADGAEFRKPDPLPWRNGPRPTEPTDDAGLIRLLAQLHQVNATVAAIEAEGRRLPPGPSPASRDQERRLDAAADRQAETIDSIISAPAHTAAGMQAKAEALGLVILAYAYRDAGETLEEIAQQGDTPDRLALSLARDVLAGRAAA